MNGIFANYYGVWSVCCAKEKSLIPQDLSWGTDITYDIIITHPISQSGVLISHSAPISHSTLFILHSGDRYSMIYKNLSVDACACL